MRNGDVSRKAGSGRPVSMRTPANIAQVRRRIKSPHREPGTHLSLRRTAFAIGLSRSTVQRIIRKDLMLKPFKKIRCHKLTPANTMNQRILARALRNRFQGRRAENKIVFTDEKMFELQAPFNGRKKTNIASSR